MAGEEKGAFGERLGAHDERRVHARVHTSAQVELSGPLGHCLGLLIDLSLGGARILAAQPVGYIGEMVDLILSHSDEETMPFPAEVMRLEENAEGTVVALKFALTQPGSKAQLQEALISLFQGSGAGTRRHPRLARRLDIGYQTPTELRGILQDISEGGMAMTTTEPIAVGEEVTVMIPDSAGDDLLSLRARVVNQRPSDRDPPSFRVGLEFLEMPPEKRYVLDELFRYIVGQDSGD